MKMKIIIISAILAAKAIMPLAAQQQADPLQTIGNMEQQLSNLKSQIGSLQQELQSAKAQVTPEAKENSKNIALLNTRIDSLNNVLTNLRSDNRRLTDSISGLTKKLKAKDAEIASWQERAGDANDNATRTMVVANVMRPLQIPYDAAKIKGAQDALASLPADEKAIYSDFAVMLTNYKKMYDELKSVLQNIDGEAVPRHARLSYPFSQDKFKAGETGGEFARFCSTAKGKVMATEYYRKYYGNKAKDGAYSPFLNTVIDKLFKKLNHAPFFTTDLVQMMDWNN